jgi:hypothetical protein
MPSTIKLHRCRLSQRIRVGEIFRRSLSVASARPSPFGNQFAASPVRQQQRRQAPAGVGACKNEELPMKAFSIVLAGGLLLGAPAFADSVTVQTHDSAGVAVSPPVATMPAPAETREKDTIKQSDEGMKREEKRTQETVTPAGKSRTTTKTKTETDNDD